MRSSTFCAKVRSRDDAIAKISGVKPRPQLRARDCIVKSAAALLIAAATKKPIERGASARIRVALPASELEPLVILKGSVAVDGVSLTVAALGDLAFEAMVIPHTLAVTTLGRAGPGARVNLEMDVLGKYLLRALSLRGAS